MKDLFDILKEIRISGDGEVFLELEGGIKVYLDVDENGIIQGYRVENSICDDELQMILDDIVYESIYDIIGTVLRF